MIMKKSHPRGTSVSQEDYLKAIWEIVQEEQVPIAARLAEDLAVTPPAVTAALKRMTRGGYLRVKRDGRILLTASGRETAEHLVLRHRLAEKLLTEVIGIDWTRAHDEAEMLEHGMSPEVVGRLLERFGVGSFCPHGVPLRGGLARLRQKHGALRLSETDAGANCEVVRVYEKDRKFLEFLDGEKLRPGTRLSVSLRQYDETMQLVVNGRASRPLHLGKPATERIWVRLLPR
jgi:DtxR family Mn-dependent transcriptional regulator